MVTSCKIPSFFIVVGCIEKFVYSVVQLEGYLYIGGGNKEHYVSPPANVDIVGQPKISYSLLFKFVPYYCI